MNRSSWLRLAMDWNKPPLATDPPVSSREGKRLDHADKKKCAPRIFWLSRDEPSRHKAQPMDISDSEIINLKKMVTAAHEEFYMAVKYHEVWKPSAYDKDLHSRMRRSYASQAFLVIRDALGREMVLALTRVWDRHKQAVRMSLIVHTIRKSAVIDALAAERAKPFNWPGVFEQMRADLQVKADRVIELVSKYSEGGSHNAVREDLLRLRDERLAHRQMEPSTVAGGDKFNEAVEEFYQDNAKIIQELLSLANAEAYDPLDAAEVYQRYAAEFWAGVRGERTEGHPHFRPGR